MIDIHFKVNKHLDTCHLHYIFLLGIRTVVRFTASEIEMHFPYYYYPLKWTIDKGSYDQDIRDTQATSIWI